MEKLLSIIVPVYNEERLIQKSLPQILALKIKKEVIVVDDGSSDRTLKLLNDLSRSYDFKLIPQKINKGKGAAIKKALEHMKGDYFVICDADLEYDPEDIISLYEKILSYDSSKEKIAVYGSRFLINRKISFHFLVNYFLTSLNNILFKSNLTDMETCFKLVPKQALEEIKLSGKRFEFEPELSAQLLKNDYKIIELPISYNRRSYREGKKITARDGFLAISTMLKERFSK